MKTLRLRPYLSAFRVRALLETQYRGAALGGLVTQVFFALVYIALYHALYASGGAQETPLEEVVTYVWLQQMAFRALLSADGELHSVYEGHDAHDEPGGGRAPEGVAEGKGESPRQQGDGQPVQQQYERLVQHLAQHREHGDGVRPERKKRHRHGAGKAEQDGWNKAKRPGISFQDGSVILSVSSR